MAVAIWPKVPTESELLEDRALRGWKPTPTMTRDGPVVMGAACAWVPRVKTQTITG